MTSGITIVERTRPIAAMRTLIIDTRIATTTSSRKKNTVAILFPYVRSAFTLLTAQPGMEPVVLPALNINALIDELERKES